jgi:glycosylphosphatidylinositol deacylase
MSEIAHKRLADTSLISITGGLLDEILPADYTTLGFLVPPSHGFTVYTTGIPNVWTPIDHLAIVWCHQLRHKVAKVLLDIADFSSPSRTYSLPQRLSTFKEHLLTGFENITSQDKKVVTSENDIHLNLDASQVTFVTPGDTLRINPDIKRSEKHPNFNIFQLSPSKDNHFALISSLPMTVWKEFSKTEYINPSVLICSKTDSLNSEEIYDYTTESTTEAISLQCIDITLDQRPIPNSQTDSLADSSYGGDKLPFYGMKLNSALLKNFEFIVVVERLESSHDEFVLGQVSNTDSTNYTLGSDSFFLLTSGAHISLPHDRAIATNIKVPGAWSSLLAYDVSFKFPKSVSPSFAPIVRQWSSEPYETKWHIDIETKKRVTMTMHGIAPYTPFRKESGMNIELWSDPVGSEASELDIKVKINWLTSLRLLVIRYRLALVAFCVLVTLYVLTIQLRTLQNTLKFTSFIQGLQVATSLPNFLGICLVLALLTPIVKLSIVQKVLNLIDPVVLRDPNEINLALHREFKLNSFYLGLEEECLFFLGPLFYTIAIGLVYFSYNTLLLIGMAISQIITFSRTTLGAIPKNMGLGDRDTSKDQRVRLNTRGSTSNDSNSVSILNGENISYIWKSRQILVIVLLVLAVPFYIPYQFVYIVCCCIQAIKLIKVFVSKQDTRREVGSNRISNMDNLLNYQMSWLILMLWILPVNIPILIVFVHNLSVNWTTPFSSHHNFLSIIPIIIVTQKNSRMTIVPGTSKNSSRLSNTMITVIIWYCYYFIFYSIIYGIRHTYWLHHLFNILCCLLLVLYYEDDQMESEKEQ